MWDTKTFLFSFKTLKLNIKFSKKLLKLTESLECTYTTLCNRTGELCPCWLYIYVCGCIYMYTTYVRVYVFIQLFHYNYFYVSLIYLQHKSSWGSVQISMKTTGRFFYNFIFRICLWTTNKSKCLLSLESNQGLRRGAPTIFLLNYTDKQATHFLP